MSSVFEMIPPAPAKSSADRSENTKGIRRIPRVHVCVRTPEAAASEGENVVDDIPLGLNMRLSTNSEYETLESRETRCAPTMNGWSSDKLVLCRSHRIDWYAHGCCNATVGATQRLLVTPSADVRCRQVCPPADMRNHVCPIISPESPQQN